MELMALGFFFLDPSLLVLDSVKTFSNFIYSLLQCSIHCSFSTSNPFDNIKFEKKKKSSHAQHNTTHSVCHSKMLRIKKK